MKTASVSDVVPARLHYLAPGSAVNRRFITPTAELNTGRYEPVEVKLHDARLEKGDTLDSMGFMLAEHRSKIGDFRDRAEVESLYQREVCAVVRERLGADLVLPMGGVRWTSGADVAGADQAHAGNVHVDVTPQRARALAAMRWRETGRGGSGYRRFVVSNCWRVISPPPQDWPLALCDFRSVEDDEGVPSVSIYCNNLPADSVCETPIAGEEHLPAASVFAYNPAHRWYYYPDMTRDEALLFKFFDSDPNRAWRTPHVAFQHPSVVSPFPRMSIEMRTVAYFL